MGEATWSKVVMKRRLSMRSQGIGVVMAMRVVMAAVTTKTQSGLRGSRFGLNDQF